MAEFPDIPIPTGTTPVAALIQWANANPEAVPEIVRFINSMKNLEIVAIIGGVPVRCPINWAKQNAVIQIPIS